MILFIFYVKHKLSKVIQKFNFEIYFQITLYHWDLPQPLQDLGGWTNEETIKYYKDYIAICFKLFGDRVKRWISINEPYSICESTYGDGVGAPHIKSPGFGDYICGKNILLAHMEAYHIYDKYFRKSQKGGYPYFTIYDAYLHICPYSIFSFFHEFPCEFFRYYHKTNVKCFIFSG